MISHNLVSILLLQEITIQTTGQCSSITQIKTNLCPKFQITTSMPRTCLKLFLLNFQSTPNPNSLKKKKKKIHPKPQLLPNPSNSINFTQSPIPSLTILSNSMRPRPRCDQSLRGCFFLAQEQPIPILENPMTCHRQNSNLNPNHKF